MAEDDEKGSNAKERVACCATLGVLQRGMEADLGIEL
jgi:hypothetical protein